MRKYIILILTVLMLLTGCAGKPVQYDNAEGPRVNMEAYGSDSRRFHFINYEQLFELLKTEVTTIVYVGHEGCPWCETLVPYLA